jgi:hypothetical protein
VPLIIGGLLLAGGGYWYYTRPEDVQKVEKETKEKYNEYKVHLASFATYNYFLHQIILRAKRKRRSMLLNSEPPQNTAKPKELLKT